MPRRENDCKKANLYVSQSFVTVFSASIPVSRTVLLHCSASHRQLGRLRDRISLHDNAKIAILGAKFKCGEILRCGRIFLLLFIWTEERLSFTTHPRRIEPRGQKHAGRPDADDRREPHRGERGVDESRGEFDQ